MTNETVVAYTFVGFPNVFADPSKVDRGKVGYGYAGLFKNGVAQIPSFGQYGPSEAAFEFNPGGFEAGGASQGLYADKWMPSVSDTLTKVVSQHTFKAGIFYEWIRNSQPANNDTNGLLQVSATSNFSYGNEYADLLTGNLSNYTETNKNRINDIHYTTWEFFGQDSWKATRKLTVDVVCASATSPHGLTAKGSATRSSICHNTVQTAPPLPPSAALNGMGKISLFLSEDSPPAPCSISRD